MTWAVKGETHDGYILTIRKGFDTQEAAEDHPVTLSKWRCIWVERWVPAPPKKRVNVKEPTLPPFPWRLVLEAHPSTVRVVVADATGKKIAVIAGSANVRRLIADFIIDACNTLNEVEGDTDLNL
jgi:hypothetical protein